MPVDELYLARLLVQDRDALVGSCTLPTAQQTLLRARLHAARRRATRVAVFIDRLTVAALGVMAIALAAVALLYVPPSDRVAIVVVGAFVISGVAVLTALVAMQTTFFGSQAPSGPKAVPWRSSR